MESLNDIFFDEPEFGSVSITELDADGSWDSTDDESEWTYVRARTQSRTGMMYTDGIFRVYRTKTAKPLTEEVVEAVPIDEIPERMPRSERENNVVPSPSGEYLTVVEVKPREHDDGTVSLRTAGRTETIPSEFIKESLTYDEAFVELCDEV